MTFCDEALHVYYLNMCGIAGIFLPKSRSCVEPALDAMMRVMVHRGPDGNGSYVSGDKRYQTGFVRLSIIDVQNGNQPLLTQDGSLVLSGNGEIYNYLELRMAHKEFPYQTQGDMEVLLPLYTSYGLDFVKHINGMFGIALYDHSLHQLILLRDRLGIKPLYWAELEGGGVIYGSEVKAIYASGLVDRAVDEAAIPHYIAHGYVPAPKTIFKGVKKLPPGHMLIASPDGKIIVKPYWKLKPKINKSLDLDETADFLIGTLKKSIKMQLRSDVPIGVLLSGGIDSGLLVALAAEEASKKLNTFTVTFEKAAYDEGPLAQAVARKFDTNHEKIVVKTGDLASHLPALIWHCEEPLFDPSLLPNYLVERALSKSVKVVLNGTGGDELFAGYGRYFQTFQEKQYLRIPFFLRNKLIEPFCDIFFPTTAWQLRRAKKFFEAPGEYLHDHATLFPPPTLQMIGNSTIPIEKAQVKHFNEKWACKQSALLGADITTYLTEDLLLLLDRSSMATGVEARVPFLDHIFVEHALGVPESIRAPGGRQKRLERLMASRYLSDTTLKAPKQGFAAPVSSWFSNNGLADAARHILTSPRALSRGWWSREGINRLFSNRTYHAFRIYSLLVLELSIIIHIENEPHETAPSLGLEVYL